MGIMDFFLGKGRKNAKQVSSPSSYYAAYMNRADFGTYLKIIQSVDEGMQSSDPGEIDSALKRCAALAFRMKQDMGV